mmetsp:Transcript_21081/g.65341  ORF Transcript_21081/g.65341 Transcript_21081/m.65341 type:complete len:208 (-) Transcript_21081:78-701(-)
MRPGEHAADAVQLLRRHICSNVLLCERRRRRRRRWRHQERIRGVPRCASGHASLANTDTHAGLACSLRAPGGHVGCITVPRALFPLRRKACRRKRLRAISLQSILNSAIREPTFGAQLVQDCCGRGLLRPAQLFHRDAKRLLQLRGPVHALIGRRNTIIRLVGLALRSTRVGLGDRCGHARQRIMDGAIGPRGLGRRLGMRASGSVE